MCDPVQEGRPVKGQGRVKGGGTAQSEQTDAVCPPSTSPCLWGQQRGSRKECVSRHQKGEEDLARGRMWGGDSVCAAGPGGRSQEAGESMGWEEPGDSGARAGTGGACQRARVDLAPRTVGAPLQHPAWPMTLQSGYLLLVHLSSPSLPFSSLLPPGDGAENWQPPPLLAEQQQKGGQGGGRGRPALLSPEGPTWLAGWLRKALDVGPASLQWEPWGCGPCGACRGVPGPAWWWLSTDPPDGCPSELPSRISPFMSLVASGIGLAMDM